MTPTKEIAHRVFAEAGARMPKLLNCSTSIALEVAITRKGDIQAPWTTREVMFLRENAGKMPVDAICRCLKRSNTSVETLASRLGLSLRCYRSKLVWCDECASWRTSVSYTMGRCKVCALRDRLNRCEEACAKTLKLLSPQQRARYQSFDDKRQPRALPHKPYKHYSYRYNRYELERAEDLYLRELEDWELRCLTLRYNAAKMRLSRMREKSGQSPRKKFFK